MCLWYAAIKIEIQAAFSILRDIIIMFDLKDIFYQNDKRTPRPNKSEHYLKFVKDTFQKHFQQN